MKPSWILRFATTENRHNNFLTGMLVMCAAMSSVWGFQDKVRWSKDYIIAGGQLAATVQATVQPCISSSCKAYVPYVARGEALSSTLVIQNADPAHTAAVMIRYINQAGLQAAAVTRQIDAYQSIVMHQNAAGSGLDAFSAWRGSAIVEGSTPIAVVAILSAGGLPAFGATIQVAAGQTPSNGAFGAVSQTRDTSYLPLVMRQLPTASGMGNSQIVVQNAGASACNVSIQLIGEPASGKPNFTRSVSINSGASYFYSLAGESSSNLPDNWYGSAAVTSPGNQLAVISNLYTGANTVMTYNGFAAGSASNAWLIPLFTSRLANGLSTPLAFQNLSGSTLNPGSVSVSCVRDANSPGPDTLNVANAAAIPNYASGYFNPVSDTGNFPNGWYGACRIVSAAGNVAAFVQMRTVGTDNAGAYEAIPFTATDKKVLIPLVAKRLGNGFASAVTIQNLSASGDANVTFTYMPSPIYVAAGGRPGNIVVGPCRIAASGSLIHNQRLPSVTGTCPLDLPDGWYGTLTVVSSNQPIHGNVQLTNINAQPGDTFMVHDAFTQP